MMRIMEEKPISPGARPMLTDPPDQVVAVPLMDQDQIGAIERPVEIEGRRIIQRASKLRERGMEPIDRRPPLLRDQTPKAPPVGRLINKNLMTAREELARDSPQEMGVSMVPVGDQRVIKHHDAQASTSLRSEPEISDCELRIAD